MHWLTDEWRYAVVAASDRYFPASHEEHEADAPYSAYFPALQIKHKFAELCAPAKVAASNRYLPASQSVQITLPVD